MGANQIVFVHENRNKLTPISHLKEYANTYMYVSTKGKDCGEGFSEMTYMYQNSSERSERKKGLL